MTTATTTAGDQAVGGKVSPAEVAVVAGVAFLLEVGPLFLLSGTIPLIVLALHLYIVGSLALWTFWRRRVIDLHFGLMLLLTTAVLGPIGSAGCLVALALSRLLRRGPESYQELERTLFPEIKLGPQEALCENLALGREQPTASATAASFAEIGEAGTSNQKQTMIGHFARRYRGEFAPALNQVLTDADAAVRVQAGTAVAKIEKRYVERLMKIERRVEGAPADAAARHELARTLDDYAFNGLIDEQRQRKVRAAAVTAYRQYLELQPTDEKAQLALARLLVRLGQPAEAEALLAVLCDDNPPDNTLLWYAECLYHGGRYEALRALFKQRQDAPDDDSVPHRLAPVLEYWRLAGGAAQ